MNYQVPDNTLHFNDYVKIIRGRAGIILTIFLLTFITGYVVTFYYLPKIYGATAEITVQKKDRDIEVFKGTDTYFDPVFFQAQYEILKSKKTLYPVIEKLGLHKKWAKRIFQMEQELRLDQAYDFLNYKRLEVEPKRGSNVIEIIGLSEDPMEAADIANTVAELYIQSRRSDESGKYQRGLENLRQQVEIQREEVRKARQKIEELRKSLGLDMMPGSSQDQQLGDAELQRKSTSLDDARGDLIGRRVRLEELQKLTLDQLIDALPALGLEDANLTNIRQQQLQSEAEVAKIEKSGLGEDHPRVQSLKATAKTYKDQVVALVEGKRRALAIDLEVSKARVGQLEKDVEQLTMQIRTEKTSKIAPFREAQDDAERLQNILDALNIRYKQESAEMKVEGEPVTLISKAEPGDFPVRPRKALNLALSAVVGLLFGVGMAFFIEYLDTSVKTLDDVEKYLELPVLAVIPTGVKPLNQAGEDPMFAESYRILRAKLNLESQESRGCVISVLSGGPGEGKSTTLFNLAFVSAQAGQRVLLIDSDLRRPSVHRTLGIENGTGMAELMRDENLDPNSQVLATEFPNLSVVLAGDMPSDHLGDFNSARLRQIFDFYKAYFDLILIDSPPILGVSDGSTIAREVDRVVMVVQHRRYPRDISLRAKRAIQEVSDKLVGVVLNAVAIKSDETYYYYSSYTSYGKKQSKRKKSGVEGSSLKLDKNGGGSENF